MSRPWARTSERVQTAVAGLLACALVVLPLAGSGLTVAELAAVSLVVLALAAGLTARRGVVLTVGQAACPLTARKAGPPLLRSRPTDPTHHPLAPRAPGLG